MKNIVKKIIFGTGLISLLTLVACDSEINSEITTKQLDNTKEFDRARQVKERAYSHEFTTFDIIRSYLYSDGLIPPNIKTADMDGDGDLDIVVSYRNGMIDIFENKIPQKNKK